LHGQRLAAFTITIALILASILTASGLFVLAQSRDSGDGMPVIGTLPDGEQGSTVTIRPALDDETLIGQTTSFWTLTPDVARDALTDAGLPASSDPVSQLTSMVKSTGDASLAMRILSGVYARVTDGSHDPVGVFKGEGSARIMDGVYFAANTQGTMSVFHTPDTLYMAGLVDTGHVTEQDAVEAQQQLVTPDTTDNADNMTAGDTSVNATPSDTTADAVFAPAVLRAAPTGTARNAGYDNNDLYNNNNPNSTFGVYPDPTLGDIAQTNSWTFGATDNGMRVTCIEGKAQGPTREGERYRGETIIPNKTKLPTDGSIIRQDKFDHARNTLYWGYGGPGYTWSARLAGRNGVPELQELVEGNFTFHNGRTTDGVDHDANWWKKWFMSFVTHYMAVSIMNPNNVEEPTSQVNFLADGMPVHAKHGESSWSAVFNWFADLTNGRMFNNGPDNDANHMELVLLRPADIDNQGHQILLGWRYHNYNLTISTQTWASPVTWDRTGKESAKPDTTDKNAKYGENKPCATSQAADGTWTSNSDCFHFYESVHDAITITATGASDKPNDHWIITVWFNMLTPNGKDTKAGREGTHYSMALDSIDFSEKISAAAEINGKPNPSHSYTLNSSDVKPSEVIKKGNPNLRDDYGHPYNENEEGHWPRNSKFWFDVTLGPKEGATVYGSADSLHEGASRDPKEGVTKKVTLKDPVEAFSTPGTRLGLKTEFRSDSGRKDKDGGTVWDKGKAPALGKSQPVLDHLRINPLDSVLSGGRLDCEFTLKYSPTGYGQDVRASKTLDKAEPINGTWLQGEDHETDSPQFTPTDLGMKAWMPGYYWFDVTVTRASVATAPGLSGDSYTHAGWDAVKKQPDPKESFRLYPTAVRFTPSITSQTVDANGKTLGNTTRLHDGKPSKDTLTVRVKSTTPAPSITLSNLTLTAHGTLYWSKTPGTDGTRPADAKEVAQLTPQNIPLTNCTQDSQGIVSCSGSATYNPASDPKAKGLEGFGSGYYTYMWHLDSSDYTNKTMDIVFNAGGNPQHVKENVLNMLEFKSRYISDGWRPAREQTQQDAQWTLNITKTTCIGNNTTACTWNTKQPIQGAKLTLTETDASWKPKKNGQTITLTTGKDGKANTGIQRIGSGETRYYTLTETSVPKPYAKPRNGAWHVTVTQTPGTRGAHITMQATGDALQNGTPHAASGTLTANTATGVQNQAEAWTAEIGNLRPTLTMPPQTGWTHDAGRLLAIGIITTIVTGMGIAFALHRRHTHATNMGRHEA
jgi:hypothetical protein